ncbi:hypothetical protein [Neptunomonas antarctica]|uniref:DUF1611 domain-containing protein n=1 Tax=Neptunomonas antarctica TaxID=619304 RepID=A0A1N7J4X1_9GAMM|nr:hypothetical protein [Neptunomonas antarctica]SIS44296.1 hypothetical protein SAMN05421760_101604 [Neptunomonas antarctica]
MNAIHKAKRSYITRNVKLDNATQLLDIPPSAGDLLLCKVDKIRQHTRLEDIHGRRNHLYEGDTIIVVAAQRYATDQFCAELPTQQDTCHLVAAGGIAGHVIHRSGQVKAPTEITLLGVLGDQQGNTLNLSAFAPISKIPITQEDIPVLVIIGSDMNAGKTTTACACINGLTRQGIKTAGAKLTGTGAGPDYWRMHDAGANAVVDFLDAGHPSTIGLSNDNFLDLLQKFKSAAIAAHCQVLILEIADGILQPETRALINSSRFVQQITGAIVAADSATSAMMVTERITRANFPVYAISGLFSRSPIACQEVAQESGLPVFTASNLAKPTAIDYLYSALKQDYSRAHILAG